MNSYEFRVTLPSSYRSTCCNIPQPETFEALSVGSLVHDPADVLLHRRVAGMPRLALASRRIVLEKFYFKLHAVN